MSRGVNNVTAAGEELLTWQKRNAKWRKAVETVVAFSEGQATADDVRETFKAAAKACGMLHAIQSSS